MIKDFITYVNEEKEISGVKEVVEIEGIGTLKAKLDSGNSAMCALIVKEFKEDNDTVSFKIRGKEYRFPVEEHISIVHIGKKTERPVIRLNIKFNGKTYKNEKINIKVSDIATVDEKHYLSRMLLSKQFLEKAKVLIDPAKEFELTDEKDLKKDLQD